jgi:hypothetical protein
MITLGDILKEVTNSYKLYCDLDSVLVDFNQGYKDLTGDYPPPPEAPVDKKAFWKPIDQSGGDFWANLKWMKDGKQLWNYIAPFNPEILSSPSSSQTSVEGKERWMEEHLPGVKLNLVQSKEKQIMAGPNAILIDDRQDICDRWEEAGGIAVHHTDASSTIEKLKQLGIK